MASCGVRLPLVLFPLLCVVWAPPATAQVNYIEICNYGNTRMWVATVLNRIQGFAGGHSDGNVHEGQGWTAIDVRECKEVFAEHTLQSVVAYFAVAYRDRSGVMGLLNFSPESGGEFFRSPAIFCAAEGTFSFRGPNLREAGQWCGQGAEADGSWWERVPFILKWSKSISWSVQTRNQTYKFTVRPNADVAVWRPLPRRGAALARGTRPETSRSLTASRPPAPDVAFDESISAERLFELPACFPTGTDTANTCWSQMTAPGFPNELRPAEQDSVVLVTLKPLTTVSWALVFAMRPSDFVVDSAGSKLSSVRILIPPGGAGAGVLKVAFLVPRTVTKFKVFYKNKAL